MKNTVLEIVGMLRRLTFGSSISLDFEFPDFALTTLSCPLSAIHTLHFASCLPLENFISNISPMDHDLPPVLLTHEP